ncbi:hypothetical protein FHW12_002933 [Dokdonella fugitiva]|uniref:Uncharacterized protein n=1 Tax=Dokdonella fugitiva TaxID=328517 RepID=A0A839F6K9_9GAMM|nr:hypothetical protein [Dokdonella fugitiva]MBA8888700.1 hypothetical protein [Dokdonella fugitiva]
MTNNTMVLLGRIYRDSPQRFEQLVLALWEEGFEIPRLGLRFTQQERSFASVPDGIISQDSVKFVVETKLSNAFDTAQMRNHFLSLESAQHRFALMLGCGSVDGNSAEMDALRKEAADRGIALAIATFAGLIDRVRRLYLSHHEEMLELVDDYEAFCDSQDLLPQDQWTVFVPPCGQSFEHNISERLYYCPADRAIRSTRFLGVYAWKAVQAIGVIERVVVNPVIDREARSVRVAPGESALTEEQSERILCASDAAAALGWPITEGHKFFLCGAFEPTDFRKSTPGGIQNRRYLNLREVLGRQDVPHDLAALGAALRGATWS